MILIHFFGNFCLNFWIIMIIYVAERTSYFCLVRKLIWPLWSSHVFTQWGWLIFSPDHFPGQHKNGESPPNYLFLRTFWAGRTYFLSAPFIAAESQHHEESRLIYGPFDIYPLRTRVPSWTWTRCIESTTQERLYVASNFCYVYSDAQTSSYLILGQHFLETFIPLSYNNQDHTFRGDYIIPVLKQQTRLLLRLQQRIFHSDI